MKFQMAMVFRSANNKRKEILKSQENRSICVSFFSVEVIVSTRRDPVVILKFSQGQSGRLHGVLFHVLYSGELWATLVMDSQTWWLVPHPREWWPSLTHYKVSVSTPLACLFFFRSQTESPCTVFFFSRGEVDLKHCRQILWSKRFFNCVSAMISYKEKENWSTWH